MFNDYAWDNVLLFMFLLGGTTIIAFVLVRLIGIILMLVMRKTGRFTYYWSEEAKKKRQMAGDTPVDVLGGRLVSLMTCLQANVKRCASVSRPLHDRVHQRSAEARGALELR